MRSSSVLSLLVVGLVGCATVDLPTSVDNPGESIAASEELGVAENPEARLHLQMAKDNFARAERLIEKKRDKPAKLALMRANADAELALVLLRRDGAQDELREVQSQIDALRADMKRVSQ